MPAQDKQNLYLCEWTLKLNDKSLVRRQKQTVAKQFVVKCKLKSTDDKDDDDDDDNDDDLRNDFEPHEKENFLNDREAAVSSAIVLRANGVEISQMYGPLQYRALINDRIISSLLPGK